MLDLPTRRGKAPPVDPFTGEDPAVKLEDWLPILKSASLWNRWSQEEELLQLAGHLRGHALQEWDLLNTSDRANFDKVVGALSDCLDPGGKSNGCMPKTFATAHNLKARVLATSSDVCQRTFQLT